MICDNCKKWFTAGNRPDGIPNGVKMILKDGKSITLCADCIMKVGRMDKNERNAFFDDLQGKDGGVQ